MILNLSDRIVFDLWNVIYVLLLCVVITATIIVNTLLTLRMTFYWKSFRDPINALKKEEKLKDIYDLSQEQEEVAGNRL
jgi:Tfp pilus assembly protein PilO